MNLKCDIEWDAERSRGQENASSLAAACPFAPRLVQSSQGQRSAITRQDWLCGCFPAGFGRRSAIKRGPVRSSLFAPSTQAIGLASALGAGKAASPFNAELSSHALKVGDDPDFLQLLQCGCQFAPELTRLLIPHLGERIYLE